MKVQMSEEMHYIIGRLMSYNARFAIFTLLQKTPAYFIYGYIVNADGSFDRIWELVDDKVPNGKPTLFLDDKKTTYSTKEELSLLIATQHLKYKEKDADPNYSVQFNYI